MKWITKTLNLDLETGELISKKEMEENYTIIRKQKETLIEGTTGIIIITNECRKKLKQLSLWKRITKG